MATQLGFLQSLFCSLAFEYGTDHYFIQCSLQLADRENDAIFGHKDLIYLKGLGFGVVNGV